MCEFFLAIWLPSCSLIWRLNRKSRGRMRSRNLKVGSLSLLTIFSLAGCNSDSVFSNNLGATSLVQGASDRRQRVQCISLRSRSGVFREAFEGDLVSALLAAGADAEKLQRV
jgi:hypothetical protein